MEQHDTRKGAEVPLTLRIDAPTGKDAEALRDLVYRTWLTTYPNEELNITPADIRDDYAEAFTEEGIRERALNLENPQPGSLRLCARLGDGTIAGTVGVLQHADVNELSMIYVAPEYQGQGIGTKLWEQARTFLDPHKPTVVHVVAYNTQAIHFYESLGFVDTGAADTHKFGNSQKEVPGIILRREAEEI